MNSRRALDLALFACLAGMAAWFFWPTAPAPEKISLTPAAPARVTELEPLTLPAIELEPPAPMLRPAPTPVVAAVEPVTAAPAAFDSQAELGTTVTDMIRLLQNQDFMTLFETYAPPDEVAQMPPEAKAQMAAIMQGPQIQQQMQLMIAALQSIQGTTPVYNAAGDTATYTPTVDLTGNMSNKSGTPRPMTFVKVNDRWYLKD